MFSGGQASQASGLLQSCPKDPTRRPVWRPRGGCPKQGLSHPPLYSIYYGSLLIDRFISGSLVHPCVVRQSDRQPRQTRPFPFLPSASTRHHDASTQMEHVSKLVEEQLKTLVEEAEDELKPHQDGPEGESLVSDGVSWTTPVDCFFRRGRSLDFLRLKASLCTSFCQDSEQGGKNGSSWRSSWPNPSLSSLYCVILRLFLLI